GAHALHDAGRLSLVRSRAHARRSSSRRARAPFVSHRAMLLALMANDKTASPSDGDVTLPGASPRAASWATPTVAPSAPEPSLRLPDGALWVAGARHEDGEAAFVVDPWSKKQIAPVILADARRAEAAAAAATAAFEKTRRAPSFQRRKVLKEITRLIVES